MDLTTGNIAGRLLRFTIPIILLNILNQAYVIVDNVIVARFIDAHALSVIASSSNALLIGYCLIQGAGNTCSILIGRIYGEKDYAKLKRAIFTLFAAGLVFSSLLAALFILFRYPLLTLIELPANLTNECAALIIIYAIGFIPTMLSSSCASILYGMGESMKTTVIVVTTQLLNIILDFAAIITFHMGVTGAALASLFSVTVSLLALLIQIFVLLKKREGNYRTDSALLSGYIKLSVPSMLQQTVMSVGNLMIQVLINRCGEDFINGNTVANTLSNLMIIPIISICAGFETFAAQNLGAGDHERVRKGFKTAMLIGFFSCILLGTATFLGGDFMISFYLTDHTGTAFVFARKLLFILIPNLFFLLTKYMADSVFKANLHISLFTISSMISLGVRVTLSWAFVDSFGLYCLPVMTIIGNAAASLFNWILLYYKRHTFL